jgi:hypothetical protein
METHWNFILVYLRGVGIIGKKVEPPPQDVIPSIEFLQRSFRDSQALSQDIRLWDDIQMNIWKLLIKICHTHALVSFLLTITSMKNLRYIVLIIPATL